MRKRFANAMDWLSDTVWQTLQPNLYYVKWRRKSIASETSYVFTSRWERRKRSQVFLSSIQAFVHKLENTVRFDTHSLITGRPSLRLSARTVKRCIRDSSAPTPQSYVLRVCQTFSSTPPLSDYSLIKSRFKLNSSTIFSINAFYGTSLGFKASDSTDNTWQYLRYWVRWLCWESSLQYNNKLRVITNYKE